MNTILRAVMGGKVFAEGYHRSQLVLSLNKQFGIGRFQLAENADSQGHFQLTLDAELLQSLTIPVIEDSDTSPTRMAAEADIQEVLSPGGLGDKLDLPNIDWAAWDLKLAALNAVKK